MKAHLGALFALILVATVPSGLAAPVVHADLLFIVVSPQPNATIANATPTIVVHFNATGPGPRINNQTVLLWVDGTAVDLTEEGKVDDEGLIYHVSPIFAMQDGSHNVSVRARDATTEIHTAYWTFTVNTHPAIASHKWTLRDYVVAGFLGLGGLVILGAGGVVYVWQFKGFTWEKFVVRHPRQRALLPIYASAFLSVVATLAGLLWMSSGSKPPRFSAEYLILAGGFVALGPYALDVQRQRARAKAYERAYGQFLFELADALRGGIDPMKSVIELSKTETGVLGPHLRVAADGLRIGRPFDTVMRNMAQPLQSSLIARYAALVGEAAKVGGEISNVVHRAARDLDELVKINQERQRQMVTPVVTMYIAYAVLLWMVKSLLDFAPDLVQTDFASSGLFGSTSGPPVARMSLPLLQERFLHLTLLTSLGTGLLVGSFVEGKLRFGLMHAFVMLGGAAAFFYFMVL